MATITESTCAYPGIKQNKMPIIISEQYPWKVPTIQGYGFSSLTQRQENNWNTAKISFEFNKSYLLT